MRKCISCKRHKEDADFYRSGKSAVVRNVCKKCTLKKQKNRINSNPLLKQRKVENTYRWRDANREKYLKSHREWARKSPSGIYQRVKASTKKRKYTSLITKKQFLLWFLNTPKRCAYCGVSESDTTSECLRGRQLTIDRIDSKKGYVLHNIVFACVVCNCVKSDVFSFSEMKEIARKYIVPKYHGK